MLFALSTRVNFIFCVGTSLFFQHLFLQLNQRLYMKLQQITFRVLVMYCQDQQQPLDLKCEHVQVSAIVIQKRRGNPPSFLYGSVHQADQNAVNGNQEQTNYNGQPANSCKNLQETKG